MFPLLRGGMVDVTDPLFILHLLLSSWMEAKAKVRAQRVFNPMRPL